MSNPYQERNHLVEEASSKDLDCFEKEARAGAIEMLARSERQRDIIPETRSTKGKV
jgi:hypothetical protein